MKPPTFKYERALRAQGYHFIAGIDEVGCGALAGPVVAAACVVPLNSRLSLIRDSKLLSPAQRRGFLPELLKKIEGYAIGEAGHEEVDQVGLRKATLRAMMRAYDGLAVKLAIDYVLVDAWEIPELPVSQQGIIRGDRVVKSIAAASIIAKVYRDELMEKMADLYPGYGFSEHKGYATREHRECLRRLGPCPIHRKNFAPVREVATFDARERL